MIVGAPQPGSVAEGTLAEIDAALGGGDPVAGHLDHGASLSSAFAVSDLAQACAAAAGVALARLVGVAGARGLPAVRVDRDLASAWFASSIRPVGWTPSPVWDALAGDYEARDGWIRLHTNSPHHRAAALTTLACPSNRDAVRTEVARWSAEELESAVVAAGGAAAVMRSFAAWRDHPVGRAVASEPLVADMRIAVTVGVEPGELPDIDGPAPLSGVRVLDLTRVVAGPVATRTLAGWGADVLRIDPPGRDEGPAVLADLMPGKRSARLDLRREPGRQILAGLLAGADVILHSLRADALDRLGLGDAWRRTRRPDLVDVSLNAYGWTGPWRNRRGFDSLVQMSAGIADTGRAWAGALGPVPLPVQALDHATGLLLAAAALTGLRRRQLTGGGSRWRLSLARTAQLMSEYPPGPAASTPGPRPVGAGTSTPGPRPAGPGTSTPGPRPAGPGTSTPGPRPAGPGEPGTLERTDWGEVLRLTPPIQVAGAPLRWDRPARRLGSDEPAWRERPVHVFVE